MTTLPTNRTLASTDTEHLSDHNELATGHNLDETHRARTDNPHVVTLAQVGGQASDADLTAIAALNSATAGAIASDGAGWVHKTYAAFKTALGLVKGDVGLGNVDNVQQQPLDADLTTIAGLNSATAGAMASDGAGWLHKTYAQFKTALGLVKGDVGLGNVDNTSDVNKPVSSAQQTAIDGKQTLDSDLTTIAGFNSATAGAMASDGAGWLHKTYAQFKTALGLVKGDVGLGNVDNTTDAGKPVSTAQQTALDLKINLAIADTKGDLLAATAADTFAKRAAPSNGHVLIADSTTGSGWKDSTGSPGATNFLRGDGAFASPFIGDLLDHKRKVKSGNEGVTSSTTLQNDDHLLLAMAANEEWEGEIVLRIQGEAAGSIKLDFTVPSGTCSYGGTGVVIGGDAASGSLNTTTVDVGTAIAFAIKISITTMVVVKFRAVNGATPGNLQLRWAQNASNGTATTVLGGSYMVCRRWA